jgi:hypothetical protein
MSILDKIFDAENCPPEMRRKMIVDTFDPCVACLVFTEES